jgi:integrase
MPQLPNGCDCSMPSVHPSKWKTVSASTKEDWYIQYYFRDPTELKKYPNGKLVIVKRMNRFKDVSERREITKIILEQELAELKKGYNPIKKKHIAPVEDDEELSPKTPFIQALRSVHEKLTCAHSTFLDIRSTIKYVEIASENLEDEHTLFKDLPIKKIRRRHIKRILQYCAETNKSFTDNTFNAYRKNLGILFKELVEMDAMETNITRDISKKTTIRKIKRVLTPYECYNVSEWVKRYDRHFWLLIHIFFHSGCRTTEIFRVKRKHVNLENQTVLITVMKGNQPFEVLKPIKNIAVDFWDEAIKGAKSEDFVFAKGLIPGKISISPRQATRRWKRHVKGKLGIICDWYSLKHLNSDQVSKEKGLKVASLLNSHTNTNTTKIYAVSEDERMKEDIKEMTNTFGQKKPA